MFLNKRNFCFLLIILFGLAFIYYVFLPMLTETFIQEGNRGRNQQNREYITSIVKGVRQGGVPGMAFNAIANHKAVQNSEVADWFNNAGRTIDKIFKI